MPLPDPSISQVKSGLIVPIPTFPSETIRTCSEPPVSIETVSAPGNLIFVFESPLWIMLSVIIKLPDEIVIQLLSKLAISVASETKPTLPLPFLYRPVFSSPMNVMEGAPNDPEGKVPPAFR